MGLWRRYLDWRQRNVGRLVCTADGFTLLFGESCGTVRWPDVDQVFAFKRDLMTVDLLCIAFRSEGTMIEIDEQMNGFDQVEAAMHRALAIDPAWKLEVLFPAFDPNPAVIFERAVA